MDVEKDGVDEDEEMLSPLTRHGMHPASKVLGSEADVGAMAMSLMNSANHATILKDGYLKKRVVTRTVVWAERHVTLSTAELLISNECGGEIRDSLDLLDITECELYDGNDQPSLMKVDNLHRMAKAKAGGGRLKNAIKKVGDLTSSSSRILSTEKSLAIAEDSLDGEQTLAAKGRVESLTASKKAAKYAVAMGKLSKDPSLLLDDFKIKMPEDHSLESLQWSNTLRIHTEKFARTYYLRADTEEVISGWMVAINRARAEAFKLHERNLELSSLQVSQ